MKKTLSILSLMAALVCAEADTLSVVNKTGSCVEFSFPSGSISPGGDTSTQVCDLSGTIEGTLTGGCWLYVKGLGESEIWISSLEGSELTVWMEGDQTHYAFSSPASTSGKVRKVRKVK